MGNLIIGIPIGGQTGGGVRPYVSGGVGLLRSQLDDVDDFFDVDESSFGIERRRRRHDLLQRQRGIRGDLRYFRSFDRHATRTTSTCRLGSFDFWRASAGVTFRF